MQELCEDFDSPGNSWLQAFWSMLPSSFGELITKNCCNQGQALATFNSITQNSKILSAYDDGTLTWNININIIHIQVHV